MTPRAADSKDTHSPEYKSKFERGHVFMISIWQNRTLSMTKNLIQWFIYSIVIGIFAAYVASWAVSPDAEYMHVFRFAGVTVYIDYAAAS